MKLLKQLLAIGGLCGILALIGFIGFRPHFSEAQTSGYNTAPTFISASSTTFTLTTSSLRLLASSTPTRRLAATIQPLNCPTNGGAFLALNRDVAAVANTGLFAAASTTLELKDYPNLPVVQGAVTGITAAGTCTVLVTEWVSRF